MTVITDDMVATWKVNYGLDTRGPAEAMKWWADAMDGKAPAGAVAALGLLLEERERIIRHIRSAMGYAEAGYDDVAWRLLATLVGPDTEVTGIGRATEVR